MAAERMMLQSNNGSSWKIMLSLAASSLAFMYILYCCHETNSLALTSFLYLTVFDIASSVTCLISIWVSKQKPTPVFSFGFDRANVLAVFSSCLLSLLLALTVLKHSTERFFNPPKVNTDGMILPLVVGVAAHFAVSNFVSSKPLLYAAEGASANFMQRSLSELGFSICGASPLLGRLLIKRANPVALLVGASTAVILVAKLLVEYEDLYIADVAATVLISFLVCGTLLPLSMYCAKILLQTAPKLIVPVLDKSLREVSTLDGVLECRNEHFWTIGFGTLTGSLHVRVRRDASEQDVLQKVTALLAPHVSHLTVQVIKDDWTIPLMGPSPLLGTPPYRTSVPPQITLSPAAVKAASQTTTHSLAVHPVSKSAAELESIPAVGPLSTSSAYLYGGPTAATIGGFASHAGHVTGSMTSYHTTPTFNSQSTPSVNVPYYSHMYHSDTNDTFQV